MKLMIISFDSANNKMNTNKIAELTTFLSKGIYPDGADKKVKRNFRRLAESYELVDGK